MNQTSGNSDPIGSGKTRPKPRLVKLRKHTSSSSINPNSNIYPDKGGFDPGFNPFLSSSDHIGMSTIGKMSFGSEGFVFGTKTGTHCGVSEYNVVDSMTKLKIGTKPDINLNPSDEAEKFRLENELRNLKIASSVFVESPNNENLKLNVDTDMKISDDLEKMNIKGPIKADESRVNNNTDDTRAFVNKNTNQGDASFRGILQGMNFGRDENVLSNEMERLRLAREGGDIPSERMASFGSCPGASTSFSSEGFIFRTPVISNPNESIFNAKREPTKDSRLKKNRGKLKNTFPNSQDFVSSESTISLEHQEESYGSYSPMDVSPYREQVFDNEETGTTAIDEDLVIATQCLDLRDADAKFTEREAESCQSVASESFESELPKDGFDSEEGETESFVTADVELEREDDSINDTFVTAGDTEEVSSSSRVETEIHGFSTNFTFAAATSSTNSQFSSSTRQQKKKNRYKIINDSAPTSKIEQGSSYMEILSPRWGRKGDLTTSLSKRADGGEASKEQKNEQESSFTPAASLASREACDKWRLRGNQAYANGDMLSAEEYYSQGVNCISQNENSKSCLKALMLCYSNRAATRMSLGRVKEALEDCKKAVLIDPNFLRVQVRAANCYLALGDVEEALQHFTKCLQSGNDSCVEQKLGLEASEGMEKSQRVSEWMKQSTELVQRKDSNAAQSALSVTSEALKISCYSEKLLELKAEALFTLGKYEELIHLCEQTLSSAELNHVDVNLSIRLWRFQLIIKSYFSLGRLEDALDYLKKQEGIGSNILESTIPLIGTIRELLLKKGAGNEAFKKGNYAEAVEHYTASLSSSVESKPFSAVCFCNRGAAYQAMGKMIDAIADCSIAIALDGKYLKAISRRASLFEMIRDYDNATKDLQRVASFLIKQVEEEGQFGSTDKLRHLNDLRQVQQRISVMDEDAKLEIPLHMYLILGVDPSVTAFEIKKAYRKAALKHHPDKVCQFFARSECVDDLHWKEVVVEVHKDADKIFKMIGEAYAILSDPTKRSRYDIDEEMRTVQNRNSGGRRMYTDNSPYDRESGSSKREAWRTYGNNFQSRGT